MRGVRIGAGRLRGRRLPVAAGVRPSGARLRESLFDLWRERLPGSRFLDLFAGTGAVGLEAVGRGARRAVLVEGAPAAFALLRRQCERLAPGEASALRLDLPAGLARLARSGERFDLVFADPPYDFDRFDELLAGLPALLAAGGEAAVEHSARLELPTPRGLARLDLRTYGDQRLAFYRAAGGAPSGAIDSGPP